MKKAINLELTIAEKQLLKSKKILIKDLPGYAIDELIAILNPAPTRAKTLNALFEFQSIPSVGVKFAHDLMLLGYYNLAALKDQSGPDLLDRYEQKTGAWTDPCVEDQFWLVVHHANNPHSTKQWWHFTPDRKLHREKHGYPPTRPVNAWHLNERYAVSSR